MPLYDVIVRCGDDCRRAGRVAATNETDALDEARRYWPNCERVKLVEKTKP